MRSLTRSLALTLVERENWIRGGSPVSKEAPPPKTGLIRKRMARLQVTATTWDARVQHREGFRDKSLIEIDVRMTWIIGNQRDMNAFTGRSTMGIKSSS